MVELRKRERKTVERFKPDTFQEPSKTVVQQGSGVKLSDIPNVVYKLDKLKGTDEVIEQLHTVLFKSKGKALSRKRDIKAFSGLVYEDNEEEEAKKVEARVSKLTIPQLHSIMDILDIPRGSDTKEKKTTKLVQFLENPEVLNEKDLKAQAAAKRAKASAKKEKATAKKETPKSKGVTKKTSKATPAKKTDTKKETAKKTSAKKDTASKATEKKRKAAEAKEEPAAKRAKKTDNAAKVWSTPEELQKEVEAIVEEIIKKDGGTIKLKAVYDAVGSKFGLSKEDLQAKKAEIKAAVQKLQDANDSVAEETEAADPEAEDKEEKEDEANGSADVEMKDPESPTEEEKVEEEPVQASADEPVAQNEPTPELEAPSKPAEAEIEPTILEPSSKPASLVSDKLAQADEVTDMLDTAAQPPISQAVPTVEEPVLVEQPLIQTPATLEGDELAEPENLLPTTFASAHPYQEPANNSFDPDTLMNIPD